PNSTGTRTQVSSHHGTPATSRESVTSLGAQQSALMPAPPATRSNPRPCTRDLHTVHSHRLPGWSPPTLSMRTSDVDLRFHSESGAPRAARPRSRSLSGKPGGSTHSTASTPTPGQAQPDNPVLPTTREESATSSGQVLLSGVSGLCRVPPGWVGCQAANAAGSGSSVTVSPACRAACSAAAFGAASASIVSVAVSDSRLI